MNKSIQVYKGKVRFFRFENTLFEHEVPTFAPEIIRSKLTDDFETYDPGYKLYNSSTDPILVNFPDRIRYAIFAVSVLHKIREYFPTCQILVNCRPEYKVLLPLFTTYLSSRTGREKFYRNFDLRESNLCKYWLTSATERIDPIHELMLKGINLYNTTSDNNLEIKFTDKEIKDRSGYAIVHNDSPFSQHILQSLKSPVFDVYLEGTQPSFSNLRGVIYLCDSPEIFRTVFFKTSVMVFMPDTIYKHQFQLKQFGISDIFKIPESDGYESALKEINYFLGSGIEKQKHIIIEKQKKRKSFIRQSKNKEE